VVKSVEVAVPSLSFYGKRDGMVTIQRSLQANKNMEKVERHVTI
jgi:hypothetical protein